MKSEITHTGGRDLNNKRKHSYCSGRLKYIMMQETVEVELEHFPALRLPESLKQSLINNTKNVRCTVDIALTRESYKNCRTSVVPSTHELSAIVAVSDSPSCRGDRRSPVFSCSGVLGGPSDGQLFSELSVPLLGTVHDILSGHVTRTWMIRNFK
jgi:hypothetical protein